MGPMSWVIGLMKLVLCPMAWSFVLWPCPMPCDIFPWSTALSVVVCPYPVSVGPVLSLSGTSIFAREREILHGDFWKTAGLHGSVQRTRRSAWRRLARPHSHLDSILAKQVLTLCSFLPKPRCGPE